MTDAPPQTTGRAAAPEGSSVRRWEFARLLLALLGLGLLAAAWKWTPLRDYASPTRLSEWLGPYREAWYALPAAVVAFTLLGFVMVPVMGMVLACGLIFGPILGSVYGLAGSLASAVAGFAAGRKLGRETLERALGPRARRLGERVAGDGVIAVYVIRKIPAPFTLVNMVIGASSVRFIDFLLGTILGMGPIVVVFSIGGANLPALLSDPSPRMIALMAALLLVPVPVAIAVDRAMKRRRRSA